MTLVLLCIVIIANTTSPCRQVGSSMSRRSLSSFATYCVLNFFSLSCSGHSKLAAGPPRAIHILYRSFMLSRLAYLHRVTVDFPTGLVVHHPSLPLLDHSEAGCKLTPAGRPNIKYPIGTHPMSTSINHVTFFGDFHFLVLLFSLQCM